MKIKTILLQLLVPVAVFFLFACKTNRISGSAAATAKQVNKELNRCNQTIRYYSESAKVENASEITFPSEIVINPSAKLISISSAPPDQGKVKFDAIVESFDCTLNPELAAGEGLYRGYIKQLDGSTTKFILKVGWKDGRLAIFNGDPEAKSEHYFFVHKWEVVTD